MEFCMNPKIAKKAEAVEFGRALRDFGLNILVSDVATLSLIHISEPTRPY